MFLVRPHRNKVTEEILGLTHFKNINMLPGNPP